MGAGEGRGSRSGGVEDAKHPGETEDAGRGSATVHRKWQGGAAQYQDDGNEGRVGTRIPQAIQDTTSQDTPG